MNQHLGATYALSVMIVVSSAIAFYRADGTKNAPKPPAQASGSAAVSRRPRPDARSPAVAQNAPDRPDRLAADRQASVRLASSRSPAAEVETRQQPLAQSAGRSPEKANDRPRGAFTRVAAGESLADVSQRLYGSPDRAAVLWRANRDQLPSQATPLEAGMMLRTP